MAKLTEAEKIARYDAERAGSLYTKPSTLLLAVADLIDDTAGEKPIGLQITRHTTDADNESATDPWTTYAFGDAEIDIHDASGGNLCLPGLCHNFQDVAAMFDLVQLLSNPTVQQALERADENAIADEVDHILAMPDGREIPVIRSRDQAHRDQRWDAITEQIAALDEPERSEVINYAMGLFDGMLMRKRSAAA